MRISSVPVIFLISFLAGCSGRSVRPHLVEVSVTDLLADPTSWEGRDVTLVGMFGGVRSSVQDPFLLLSRTAPVWRAEGSKEGVLIQFPLSENVRLYEVLRIQGQVCSSGEGVSVEAFDVRSWGDPLFHPVSLALMRAGFLEEGSVAREKLLEALQGNLSYAARYAAHMKVGSFYEKQGFYKKAMQHYDWADGFTNDPDKVRVSRHNRQRARALEEKRRLIEGLEED